MTVGLSLHSLPRSSSDVTASRCHSTAASEVYATRDVLKPWLGSSRHAKLFTGQYVSPIIIDHPTNVLPSFHIAKPNLVISRPLSLACSCRRSLLSSESTSLPPKCRVQEIYESQDARTRMQRSLCGLSTPAVSSYQCSTTHPGSLIVGLRFCNTLQCGGRTRSGTHSLPAGSSLELPDSVSQVVHLSFNV